jgi:hypothetical protein
MPQDHSNEIYDYASEIEVPNDARDKLATVVARRFNDAVRWQSQERVGGVPLRMVLRQCYDQYHGILSPTEQKIIDDIGVDAHVNLSAMKAGVVQSYLAESLIQAGQLPWTIQPTPVPDLSDSGELMVAQSVQQSVEQGFRGDLRSLVYSLKSEAARKELEHAQDIADNMMKLITDQCAEGGWNRAMFGFINNFCVYPYAVLAGPIPTRRVRMQWSGETLRPKYETFYEFKSISPWDFWWSPDSPDTQRGTGIFIRQRWTRQQLLDAAKMTSYIGENIIKVLDDSNRNGFRYHWISNNPEQTDSQVLSWRDNDTTIDILIHWGYFSGRELTKYGIPGLEDDEFYNAMVTMCGRHIIQVLVEKNPTLSKRPVFTASFYTTQDRIPGESIPQRLRDVERCYETCLRYLISNAYYGSAPITEADYARVSKYMSDEDIGRIIPGSMYFSDPELGNATPAFKYYSLPNNMAAFQNALVYFMDLADRVTNIPAALHGTAQGSGANRTFRGAAMLQSNAVKAIQSAVFNIDEFVYKPLGELLYNYNMIYSKDQTVKGDCKIMARGVTALLQKETDRQNSYEILQMVASAGQQLAALPNGAKIVQWALKNVFQNMGVPKELLKDEGVQGQNQAGQGIPGGIPGQQGQAEAAAGQGGQPDMGGQVPGGESGQAGA